VLGETRGQFLTRVRKALTHRGKPVDLPADVEIARVIRSDEDLAQVFMTRAEEAKIHVYRVADEDAMVDKVIELLVATRATSTMVPVVETFPARDRLVTRIQEQGIVLCDTDDPEASFSADVGITDVRAAIAETGSMCIASGGGRRRLASLAVPCHIAIVRAEQIVPDLIDWTSSLGNDLAASEVLVSGPSKTADIELLLVMGVHGPKVEHVILIG